MMSAFQNTHRPLTQLVQPDDSSARQVELLPDPATDDIQELVLDVKGRSVRMIDIGYQPDLLHETLHMDDAISVLFVVNLASCVRVLEDHEGTSMLVKSLQVFDLLVKSTLCQNKPGIMLLAVNAADFAQQVQAGSFMRLFPDYKGGTDTTAAERYILKRFIALNTNDLDIYPHLVQNYNDESISLALKYILSATRDTALRKALRSAADGYTIVTDNKFRALQPQRT